MCISKRSEKTEELVSCARASHADLDADLDSYADRIASLWAPRVRRGTQAEPHTPMHESSTEDSVAASMFRRPRARLGRVLDGGSEFMDSCVECRHILQAGHA